LQNDIDILSQCLDVLIHLIQDLGLNGKTSFSHCCHRIDAMTPFLGSKRLVAGFEVSWASKEKERSREDLEN